MTGNTDQTAAADHKVLLPEGMTQNRLEDALGLSAGACAAEAGKQYRAE